MNFEHKINTSGDGFWSESAKEVSVLALDVPYINEEEDFGELCVYFDINSWNISKDGLIYTDKGFKATLQRLLNMSGMNSIDVSYSEQGMQGTDYVSLDVGKKFIKSWKKVNVTGYAGKT